jgi:hypothetical protein
LGQYQPSVFSATSSSLLSIEFFGDLGEMPLDVKFTTLPAVGSRTKVLLFPRGSNWQGSVLSTPKGSPLADQSIFTAWGARWKIIYPPTIGLQSADTAVTLERLSDVVVQPFKFQEFLMIRGQADPTRLTFRFTATSASSNSGVTMIVESSKDLIQWSRVPDSPKFVANPAGRIEREFNDIDSTGSRFYRLALF